MVLQQASLRRSLSFLVAAVACLSYAGPGAALAQQATIQRPRAWLLAFDPVLESRSNGRLHSVGGWQDPATLTNGYITDIANSSYGLVQYRLTRSISPDIWPVKEDGFRYTDATYLNCLSTWSGWHTPDNRDYKALMRDFDMARKCDSGEVDEVLDHSAPYFGGYETRMIGRGGYWCNSPPLNRSACSKIFVVSVFNYERGVGEMLEDLGHRTESILWHVYGSWSADPTHAWNRFTLYDKIAPGEAACGNVHFAPNSTADYQWGNTAYVWTTADDWLNYPNLTGTKKWQNCSSWGNGDIRAHHVWWFSRIPHANHTTTEYGMTRLNNWWEYIQNFNAHPESGGDHALGGTAPPAVPTEGFVTRLTNNTRDDWAPQANAAGRLVWHGSDGEDMEIWACNADGSGLIRLTNNTFQDEDPQINAAGRVVWQAFDGTDYEIYSANATGGGLVRITNNTVQDWHPQINDAGQIAWDAFDGLDYEVYSANSDGSNLVQVTNNQAASGYPREDVWPQINNSGRIAWFGWDGSDWEVFSANSDGTGLVNVSNNTREDEYPRINDGGRIVWHSFHSNTNTEVYSAPATGGTAVRLTNNTIEDWYPQISPQGQVCWMERINSNWEVMTAPAVGGTVTPVTANSSHDQYPRFGPNEQIVWQGFDGQDWEIYQSVGGVVSQVTDNTYNDRWPAAAGADLVVWHADADDPTNGGTSEIFALNRFRYVPADFNRDADVDQSDFAHLQACYTALGLDPSAECADADLNQDDNIDAVDFWYFQGCYSGPGIEPTLDCMP